MGYRGLSVCVKCWLAWPKPVLCQTSLVCRRGGNLDLKRARVRHARILVSQKQTWLKKEKSILSKWQQKESKWNKQTNELIVFYTKKANDLFYFCLAYIFQFVLINKNINLCTIESSTKLKLSCDFSLCMRFNLPITIQTFDIHVNSAFSWTIKIQILIYLQNPMSFLRIRLLMNKSFFLKKIVCVVQ